VVSRALGLFEIPTLEYAVVKKVSGARFKKFLKENDGVAMMAAHGEPWPKIRKHATDGCRGCCNRASGGHLRALRTDLADEIGYLPDCS
jgi:hypothetical protein